MSSIKRLRKYSTCIGFAFLCVSACHSTKDSYVQAYLDSNPSATLAEAKFRTSFSHMEEVQIVSACVREKAEFAGIAKKNHPQYGIHVYFKGDAKRLLNDCTTNTLFKPVEVKYSLNKLTMVANRAYQHMQNAAIPFDGGISSYGSEDNETQAYIHIIVDEENIEKAETVLAGLKAIFSDIKISVGNRHVDELL